MKLNVKEFLNSGPSSLDQLLKMYYFHYNLLLLVVLSVHTVVFYCEGQNLVAFIMLGILLFLSMLTMIIYRLEYQVLKYFLNYYMIVKTIFLYGILFLFWKKAPEIILFFALLPLGTYNLYRFRALVLSTLIIGVFLIFFTIIPQSFFPVLINESALEFSKFKILFTFLVVALFFIFYNSKITEKKFIVRNSFTDGPQYAFTSVAEDTNDVLEKNTEMYNEIYKKIIDYLDHQMPWKKHDYSIQDLSYNFGINTTYISRAISINTGMNFKNLINSYRINYIKEEIKVNYPKYTLMYIYMTAGFKHQSTFNRAFKQIENKTPSEFIKSIEPESYALYE
ncbi:helix-turn-helix domain-containing protein [Chryseobacterium sp. RU33C]|uniref:helix-turn-helix domain-containing protein n=1 Tax=Chryseobacterium sp. RU33C TaxID=1907398 RepID=UPI000955B700|nr:AraC family transcriptional regulator [Chryseobacterium sp. RU33C]SIR29155.1 AraC-type DNA-binding protein [Chryseobacterium sp. RU33C]